MTVDEIKKINKINDTVKNNCKILGTYSWSIKGKNNKYKNYALADTSIPIM